MPHQMALPAPAQTSESTSDVEEAKIALDAVGVTRQRCWKYDWVLEFDIKGLFDNIDHELLLRAVRKHVTCKWALLYIERWLTASMEHEDGTKAERKSGTPQGGVVSPILSNLFLNCPDADPRPCLAASSNTTEG